MLTGYDVWSEYGPYRVGFVPPVADVYRNADFIGAVPIVTAWEMLKRLANADNASGYDR